MIETKDLKAVISLLAEKIDILIQLKDSLICKETDLEQKLGECQTGDPVLLKPDFRQARVIESLAYKIVGNKDRKFLDSLLTFMSSYDL